jgi:hypothetical protein
MWTVACNSKVKKPIHHISINPFKDERLTDKDVLKIIERAEQKYGYKPGEHQRVIVEHVLNGRQHFHVMWNRVSMKTGKAVWPGEHWKKSKQVCREMERELGLKRPMPRRVKRMHAIKPRYSPKRNSLVLCSIRNPAPPYWIMPWRPVVRPEAPQRPVRINGNTSGMCEAQRIDLLAAMEGRMTWREYFQKWGEGVGPRL